MALYQPIKFKRNKKSKWENGLKQVLEDKINILDNNNNLVNDIYKLKVCWFS